MKRIKLITCLTIAAFFITAFAIDAAEPSVKVLRSYGKAELLRSGKTAWQKIKKGMALYSGDSIKTYEDAYVDIAFEARKDNITGIRPKTHAVLKLAGNEKIELVDGEVFSLVRELPAGSRFEIRTPTAVCGARGTGWGARGNKAQTTMSAYENEIYAKGVQKDGTPMEDEVIIPEGFESAVRSFEKPSGITKITETDFGRWDSWRDNVAGRVSGGKAKMERLVRDLSKIESQKERIEERITEDRIRQRDESSGAGASQDPPRDDY